MGFVDPDKDSLMSLSARRAWIEINSEATKHDQATKSLSARRAWIEMIEEVSKYVVKDCRSPQGERG